MRAVQITGHVSGRTYTAQDTGETWNGSPVLAFTAEEMRAYIEAGDGADGNGYGLRITIKRDQHALFTQRFKNQA